MRLINADTLIKNWHFGTSCNSCERDAYECQYHETYSAMDVCRMIEDAPTVDAVERKRGGWIKMSDADGIYFACSICGESLPRMIQRFDPQFGLFPKLESINKTNYCPNCGADMRGGEE